MYLYVNANMKCEMVFILTVVSVHYEVLSGRSTRLFTLVYCLPGGCMNSSFSCF